MKSSNRWLYAIAAVTVLTAVLATAALLLAVLTVAGFSATHAETHSAIVGVHPHDAKAHA